MKGMMSIKKYIFNLETTKIELHFDKSEYDALTEKQKAELKSAFLYTKDKRWVSRAKEPNLYRPRRIANELGFTEEQREGERISYAEQLGRQADRAEERADRYEQYAENADKRGAQLQKPIDAMRGDTAFFTQPIIAGHAGSRAFANRRVKMFAKYERGFEEYRKSEYFKGRAQTARETAEAGKFKDKAYIDRRIKECKKEIRKRTSNIIRFEEILLALENGEQKKKYNNEPYTVEEVTGWLENEMELIEKAMDKQAYLENCLDELGGVQFSKDNIKVGYIVRLDRWDDVEIISTGPQNVIYKILTGGAAGMTLKAAYAEIKEVIKAAESIKKHPFKVGEQFTATRYTYPDENSFKSIMTEVVYEIIKASDTTIQLRAIGTNEKPITRNPSIGYNDNWAFSIDDRNGNTFYKS